MDARELFKKIEEKKAKVGQMNEFSERMHFLDDEQVVEMYRVIHKEEQELAAMIEKYEKFTGKKMANKLAEEGKEQN